VRALQLHEPQYLQKPAGAYLLVELHWKGLWGMSCRKNVLIRSLRWIDLCKQCFLCNACAESMHTRHRHLMYAREQTRTHIFTPAARSTIMAVTLSTDPSLRACSVSAFAAPWFAPPSPHSRIAQIHWFLFAFDATHQQSRARMQTKNAGCRTVQPSDQHQFSKTSRSL